MNKNTDLEFYQICHRYGKLISCDSENPAKIDTLFLEEVKNFFK